jgi:nucleotide-binding universal stress UspA family protein
MRGDDSDPGDAQRSMVMYKRILVPVDGSQASTLGLKEAIKLAVATKATVRVVHVVNEFIFDPTYAPAQSYEALLESFRTGGQRILAQAQATVREAGVECQSDLIETVGGRVSGLILAVARTWPADLIVMGTHGRRGIGRVVLGSDAEMVLRSAPVPVLLVRAQPETA